MPANRIFRYALVILLMVPFIATAQSEDGKEHKVVKGDTLWDISKQELKDPFLWPKVWKKNPAIKNPDRIYPDQIIQLPLDLVKDQKSGEEREKAAAEASRENAVTARECKKIDVYEAPEKPAVATPKKVPADRRFEDIKGITLYNGSIIEGKILSMSAETVVIRMKDGTVRSYSFVEEVEDFIRD